MIELHGKVEVAAKVVNGGISKAPSQERATYMLITPDGQQIPAVEVMEKTVFTATANDIRKGSIAATAQGVTEGTKVIPDYHTTEGYKLISAGKLFEIPGLGELERYNFTKLQAIICTYAKSIAGSVAAEKVVIDEKVYAVNSTEPLATVTRDSENQSINLGITNETTKMYLLRYFTYKEIA